MPVIYGGGMLYFVNCAELNIAIVNCAESPEKAHIFNVNLCKES